MRWGVRGMKILVGCEGTLEDVAALDKLHRHECHVVCPKRLPLAHVTHHTHEPDDVFDVAVELSDQRLRAQCKRVRLERHPLRISLVDDQHTTHLASRFLQHLVVNQPQETTTRDFMTAHLYDTAVACVPPDPPRQLRALQPYVPHTQLRTMSDLRQVLADVAHGYYTPNLDAFRGSRARWAQHVETHHLPCLSMVAVAVALTSCPLPMDKTCEVR